MCKALIGALGLFFVAFLAILNNMSLMGILSRLWAVVLCSYIFGGLLDVAFSAVFKEALEYVFKPQTDQG